MCIKCWKTAQLCLGLTVLMSILSVACQGTAPPPTATPPVVQTATLEPQIVTLELGGWGTATEQVNQVLDRFSDRYPQVNVQFIPTTSGEYDAVLEAQLASGEGPDLFYLRSFSGSQQLYDAGYLEDLTDITGLQQSFSPDVLQAWAHDDTPYGVPYTATSHGIYYNAAIFKELGLQPPETWEELMATAAAIDAAGRIPFANGTKDDWTLAEIVFMNLAPSFVGGLEGRHAYLEGERCFNDAHIVSAFEAVEQLGDYLPPNHELLSYIDSLELFVQSQAAMWMSGSWDIPYFNNADLAFPWAVFAVPAPAGQSTHVTFHLDVAIGLNADSQHKEEAQLFLTWMTTDEFARLLGNELPGFFPIHSDVPELEDEHANQFLALNERYPTDIRFSWEELGNGSPSAYALILDDTRGVIEGTTTPPEAADALQDGLAQWYAPAQRCGQ